MVIPETTLEEVRDFFSRASTHIRSTVDVGQWSAILVLVLFFLSSPYSSPWPVLCGTDSAARPRGALSHEYTDSTHNHPSDRPWTRENPRSAVKPSFRTIVLDLSNTCAR